MTKSNDKREDDSVLKRLQEMQESFATKEKEIKSIADSSSSVIKKKKKKKKNIIVSDVSSKASFDNKKNNSSDSLLNSDKKKSKHNSYNDVKKHKKKSDISHSSLLKTSTIDENLKKNSITVNKKNAETKNVIKKGDNLEKKSQVKSIIKKTNMPSDIDNTAVNNSITGTSNISGSVVNKFIADSSLNKYSSIDGASSSASYSDSGYVASDYGNSSNLRSSDSLSYYDSNSQNSNRSMISNEILSSGWIFQGSGNNIQFANEQLISLHNIESILQNDIIRIINGFQKNDFLEKFFQKVAAGIILKKDVSIVCSESLKKIYALMKQYNVDKESVNEIINVISKGNGAWSTFEVSRALIDIGFNEHPGVKKIHSAISAINEMMDDAYQKVTLFAIIDRTKKEVVSVLDSMLLRDKIDPSNNIVDKRIADKYGFSLEQCNDYVLGCLESVINANISTNNIVSVNAGRLDVQKDGVLDEVNDAMNSLDGFDTDFGLSDKYTNAVSENTVKKQIGDYVNDKDSINSASIDSASVSTSGMTINSLSKKRGLDLKK